MKDLKKENIKGQWLAQKPCCVKLYLNDTITIYSEKYNLADKKYNLVYNELANTQSIKIDDVDLPIEIWTLQSFPNILFLKIDGTMYEFQNSNNNLL
jgi:hypothetical protein